MKITKKNLYCAILHLKKPFKHGSNTRTYNTILFVELILADFLPLSHASVLITDITLRGLPLNLEHAFVMLIISFVFLTIAYIAYKFKKLEV